MNLSSRNMLYISTELCNVNREKHKLKSHRVHVDAIVNQAEYQ